MGQKKNSGAKDGRKPENVKAEQIEQLEKLFYKNEDTARSAAEKVGCSRQFAAEQFHIFADKLSSDRKTNWVERADDTLNQAIEGFTSKIEEADAKINQAIKVYEEVSKVHFEVTPTYIRKLNDSPLAKKLGTLEGEEFTELIMLLRSYLKEFVEVGFLRSTWNKEVRQERIYKTELQMQFDDLKLAVPPSVVLESLMEKALAEKMNLKPAVPDGSQIVVEKKKK